MFEKDNKGLNTEAEKCTSQLIRDFEKLLEVVSEGGEVSIVSLNDIKEKFFLLTGENDPNRTEQKLSGDFLSLLPRKAETRKSNQKLL